MTHITRIQAWAYRSPTAKPVATSFGVMHDRPAVFVRLEDNEGAFGWGEIWANWPSAGAEHRVRLLEMDIAPLILGVEVKNPTEMFHTLEAQTRIRAAQCGEVGPFAQVIAGLDIALWDMAARRAGVPLRQLIRDDAPAQVPAYASGIQTAAAADLMPRARDAGHQQFKLKVGFDILGDIAAVRAIHAGLPAGESFACDANQAWSLEGAQTFVSGVSDIPLNWLEEPLPVFAPPDQWARLAQASSIPLAGGENIIGTQDFSTAIAAGHLSLIQPDVAKWGGITGCLAVAKHAIAQGRRYFPHFLGGGIGLAASAELLAGVGGNGVLEIDVNQNPLRSAFFDGSEPVSNGLWQCHSDPGLGINDVPEPLKSFETLSAEMI